MVIGGIIAVIPVEDHLVHKPTVDAFVKMRRFYPQVQKTKKKSDPKNSNEGPIFPFFCRQP